MPDPKPIRQTLVVPKGYENHPGVIQALGRLQMRFGKENVDLVIEEGPREDPADAADLQGRRTYRLPPDQD